VIGALIATTFAFSLALYSWPHRRSAGSRISQAWRSAWKFPGRRVRGRHCLVPIEPVVQLPAGPKERMALFFYRDAVAGSRIAPDVGGAPFDRERAEAAQLDPVATRQRGCDLVEDRGDNDLSVAVVKVRVGLRQALDEVGLRHRGRSSHLFLVWRYGQAAAGFLSRI